MIKFFRKIRYDLVNNPTSAKATVGRRTGKYLKYAVGEIVLVMVGILLALQVSNWNENRKISNIEQSLLIDLRVEIETNIASLQVTMDSHQKSLDAAQEIVNTRFNPEKMAVLTDSIAHTLIAKMDRNWTFNPQLGTLNSIINSGKIDFISNKELRYKLASLRDQIDDTNESTNTVETNRPLLLYPILFNSFEGIEKIKNTQLIMFTFYFISWRTTGKEEETALLENLNAMIALIDQELEH